MHSTQQVRDRRRFRLATNDNEILVDAPLESAEESDTEGHRLATNDNEVIVERLRRVDPHDTDEIDPLGARRLRR
jgi:hypothetical protein